MVQMVTLVDGLGFEAKREAPLKVKYQTGAFDHESN